MVAKSDARPLGSTIDYAVVEVEEPAHPKCRRLLDYWRARMQPDGTVLRADFNPLDLPQLMGGMFVVEPVDGGADLRYRLVGAETERRLGRKFTGELFSYSYTPEMAADQIALHNRVMETRKPTCLQGHFIGLDLEHVSYEAIYLPVRTDNGGMQVIGGLYELAEGASK